MTILGQFRRDTFANWQSLNPILADGEFILVAMNASEPRNYNKWACGNGTSTFTQLVLRDYGGEGNPCLQETGNNTQLPMSQNAITKALGIKSVIFPQSNVVNIDLINKKVIINNGTLYLAIFNSNNYVHNVKAQEIDIKDKLNGDSALLYDLSNQFFLFLNYSEQSIINDNMAIVALLIDNKIYYQSCDFYVNGKVTYLYDQANNSIFRDNVYYPTIPRTAYSSLNINVNSDSSFYYNGFYVLYGRQNWKTIPSGTGTYNKGNQSNVLQGLNVIFLNINTNQVVWVSFDTFSNYQSNDWVALEIFNNQTPLLNSATCSLNGKLLIKSTSISDNTDNCVFMSLGDSITTESSNYYIQKLRQLLNPYKYYNLAVSGAIWADNTNSVYDGNPVFGGPDNNSNNVLGNQIQKIINNPSIYNIAPDIIIIAAGTNDGNPVNVGSNDTVIIESVNANFLNDTVSIPITSQTDTNDTYKTYRQTIAGAMRYCICKLQDLYPKAKIYILTPIQSSVSVKSYVSIETKQRYISEAARHLGLPVIHVGEHCGIHADYEYLGAMWSKEKYDPDNIHRGRDLIDGLHPNNNGGWKMANYIYREIVKDYIKQYYE